MPLRNLVALFDIEQSTISKKERGERPLTRQMIPIIEQTFGLNEKELIVKYMSKQLDYQISGEHYPNDNLEASEIEVKNLTKKNKK